jgi:Ca2+-binding EF-hand superfamily protein
LGLTESDAKLAKIFTQIDTNNSGHVDFGEFKRATRKIMVTITSPYMKIQKLVQLWVFEFL